MWKYLTLIIVFVLGSCNSPKKDHHESGKITDKTRIITESTLLNDSLFVEKNAFKIKDIDKEKSQYYSLETGKSLLTWFCVTHTGYVKFKSGHFTMIDNKIVSGEFEIAMDSIRNTDIDYDLMRIVLENTLKSDSFFNVKAHPISKIKLTHLKVLDSNRFLMGGDLQINGINNRISFRTQIIQNDTSFLVLTDRFYIDRTRWGVTIYSRNFEQTDKSFLFTDSVSMKVTAVLNRIK